MPFDVRARPHHAEVSCASPFREKDGGQNATRTAPFAIFDAHGPERTRLEVGRTKMEVVKRKKERTTTHLV